ncbi:MAG TPA: thioredoxin family protein [Micropepsaceae bacterium]|nr:thioredoxin family protein [Micropepsaceae bacterium]
MEKHRVVSHAEWIEARKAFLAEEKEFTRARDALSARRRELPWERVEKNYVFDGAAGKESLSDLFAGKSQLIVYHFMFGPDWDAGCKSCSFWADNFNGIAVHLAHRDVGFVAISRAPLPKLAAYEKRMGWSFKWLSSFGSHFNFDYFVSFTPDEMQNGTGFFNYERTKPPVDEMVGISVFAKNEQGEIFHTYSTYSRGVDMMNGAYHYLDLTPKGRDEDALPFTQSWVRRHDEYED